jgi:hypothetical protein
MDRELVREEPDGTQTVLTVRVPESAWAGMNAVVEVVSVRRVGVVPVIPQQRRLRAVERSE